MNNFNIKKIGFTFFSIFLFLSFITSSHANISGVTALLGTNTVNTASSYTVTFTTGPSGALSADNDTIIITFPQNTSVPANINSGPQVNVNGTSISTAASGSGQTLTITTPVNIPDDGSVTVIINTGASQLINPSIPGTTYTLDAHTSVEGTDISSGNYTILASSTALNVGTVVPNPSTLGNYAGYTISVTLSGDGDIWGGHSAIIVDFPNDTDVPSGTLSVTNISVDGIQVDSATGSGQQITLIPNQIINGPATFNIVFPASLHICNPTSTGAAYTLNVSTSAQPVGTSSNYSIDRSSTNLNVGVVITTPSTIGNNAAYTITITTSSDGVLLGGISEIIVSFPNNTVVPTGGLSAAGLTVNGTQVDSAIGAGQQITLIPNQTINGPATFNIVFPVSLHIRNPTSPGGYNLTAETSPQPVGTSSNYNIIRSSTNLNVGAVTATPATIGNNAAYTITITTSSDGVLLGGISEIIVSFPNNTVVPTGGLSAAGLTVNGTQVDSAIGAGQHITLIPNQTINGPATFNIVFPVSLHIRNPTSLGGYNLTAETSPQPAGTSSNYSIGRSSTNLNVGAVTATPSTIGNNADYNISFTTSSDGVLLGGISRIWIVFPDDTLVPNGALTNVTVNGGASLANGDSTSRRVTIIVPTPDIRGSTVVTVVIPGSALQNPTQTGVYTLDVETSPQPVGTSPQYSIQISSTPVTVDSVSPTTNIVNTSAGYTVNLTLDVVLRRQKSSFFMIFPYNSEVPNGSINNIMVNGTAAASANGNPLTRTITIVPDADVSPGASFPIVIPDTTILNPSIPSAAYSLGVSTTAQPTGTQTYTIQASTTRISNINVVPTPSRAGQNASYSVRFNTGAHGRLDAGNIITVQFPAVTGLPASFPTGSIRVNLVGNSGPISPVGQVVNILVPSGVMVANYGNVTVILPGISNPGVGFYQLTDVHTDAEPFPAPSPYYWITANTQITMGQVLVSPDVINAGAQYTINLILGAEGSLTQNIDKIFLSFPAGTSLPLIANPSDIAVNSSVVTGAIMLSSSRIEIISPVNVSACASDKSVKIVFQPSFGIANPPLPGAYTISGYTTIENTSVTSAPYQINPSTNTHLTSPQVELLPLFTTSYGRYRIQCQTGSLGGLVKDISTVSLVFPDNFNIPAGIAAHQISINNQPLTTAAAIINHTMVLTTPVDIASAGALEIIIETAAHIQNPSAAGDYSLSLYTRSEPTPVESNSFHIAKSTWKDVVSYPNPLRLPEARNKNFTFLFIPEQSATLRIYTLDGKLVRTLTKNDRTDSMVWNLNNEKGKQIASGIYIYKISGPGGEKKGKLAILK